MPDKLNEPGISSSFARDSPAEATLPEPQVRAEFGRERHITSAHPDYLS